MWKSICKVTLAVMLCLAVAIIGCSSSVEKAAEADPEGVSSKVDQKTIQQAVDIMKISAGVGEMDASYTGIDTKAEVEGVTVANGADNLARYLQTSYPLLQAYDITRDGKVSVH